MVKGVKEMSDFFWVIAFTSVGFVISSDRFDSLNVIHHSSFSNKTDPLMVRLSLIPGIYDELAVCLDGTQPGYHMHRGHGSGQESWLIQLEGGGWCDKIETCVEHKRTRRGSSRYMEKQIPFVGILSNMSEQNPDFYNWNRVKLRYCDGASFTGDSSIQDKTLEFRGKRIWFAAMKHFMSKGMCTAKQALLSGCSAGGLASIIHCDDFQKLFSKHVKVKCLGDAGFFLNAVDVSGGRTLLNMFSDIVRLRDGIKHPKRICRYYVDNPIKCLFPQYFINHIKTPLFILNAAYDSWQIRNSLAPSSADPDGFWDDCRTNYTLCSPAEILFLQDFRNQTLKAVEKFQKLKKNGVFINSCFSHCQTERQSTWFADDSPLIEKKTIALAVGDWYFDREPIKAIDCEYPCDTTCDNLIFKPQS